jgi:hypothetical protein
MRLYQNQGQPLGMCWGSRLQLDSMNPWDFTRFDIACAEIPG